MPKSIAYAAPLAPYAILLGMTLSASFVLYSLLTLFPLKLSRVFASVCVVLISSAVPIALAQYLLKIEFFNHTLGYILLFGIASALYSGLIIFFGMYGKAGPYATLRVIAEFFIRLAWRTS